MFSLQIPKPCPANWEEMIPTQKGAFCNACSKEVIDFTRMTDEEVQQYFLKNSHSKTCGHFRADQLQRIRVQLPENLLWQKIAAWKKYLAVVLLAFGSMLFGCDVEINHNVNGEPTIRQPESFQLTGDTVYAKGRTTIDTLQPPVETHIVGEIISCTRDTASDKKSNRIIIEKNDTQIMGAPIMVPIKKSAIDTTDYDKIFTGKIQLESKDDTATKKPATDTSKCKDTGFY